MLFGIKPCITPELLYTLARMGHGDELVLVDAYYPSHSKNPTVIRCDGVGGAELLDGIMALMNPDDYVAAPIIMMEPANGDPLDPSVEADFRAAIDRHWPDRGNAQIRQHHHQKGRHPALRQGKNLNA